MANNFVSINTIFLDNEKIIKSIIKFWWQKQALSRDSQHVCGKMHA